MAIISLDVLIAAIEEELTDLWRHYTESVDLDYQH